MSYRDPEKAREYQKLYTQNNSDKLQEAKKLYYQSNRDKILESHKVYYEKNKEKIQEQNKAYFKTNLEKVTSKRVAYWKAHPEEKKKIQATYRRTHPEKIKENDVKRRARKAGAEKNDLTASQWREIKEAHKHKCVYCGKKFKNLTMDHITPLSKGGNHTVSNVVPACISCNSKKHTNPPLVPVQPMLLTVSSSRKKDNTRK